MFLREDLGDGRVVPLQTFAEVLAGGYGIGGHGKEFGKGISLPVGNRLAEFHADEASGDWPFRELVWKLMWLSTQTRSDITNAVRAVAMYCAALRLLTGGQRSVF